MRFDQLDNLVPRVPADRANLHTNTMYVSGGFGWSVRVKWPGKHKDSHGDFVVEVLSEGVWNDYHQFKHSDLFEDISAKAQEAPDFIHGEWVTNLLGVAQGSARPTRFYPLESPLTGIHVDAFTNAAQALTVCEYRRYPQGDVRGGGRYLPINYMLAVLQGFWTPDEASKLMRVGFPALRKLDGFYPFTHSDEPHEYVASVHRRMVDGPTLD
jgi:hypothetical protein